MNILRRSMLKGTLPLPVHYWCSWIVRWKHDPRRISKEFGCAVRFFRPWIKAFKPEWDPLNSNIPWVTPQAIACIERILKRDLDVFEWGSGASTFFWAERARKAVTIEHDMLWHGRVHRLLLKRGTTNVDLRLILPENISSGSRFGDPSMPDHYATHKTSLQAYRFKQYASAIDEFPDGHFGIVFIDGRSRPSCILHAMNKVRKGGYLILDNSARLHYQTAAEWLQDWTMFSFCGPVMRSRNFVKTTFWRKPDDYTIAPD